MLRVPEAFGERFAAGRPAPVQLYSDGSDSEAGKHGGRIAAVVAGYSARVASLRLLARGISPNVVQPVVIDDVDVSTPSARATLLLGMLSYVILLATLMGGLYLAIDATAGERERGSLESLLTLPVVREHLIYGKIAATDRDDAGGARVRGRVHRGLAEGWCRSRPSACRSNFGPGTVWRVFLAVAPFALVGGGAPDRRRLVHAHLQGSAVLARHRAARADGADRDRERPLGRSRRRR